MNEHEKKAFVSYVPAIHQGYVDFIGEFAEVDEFYLLGSDIVADFDYLRKDVRALDANQARMMIESINSIKFAAVVDKQTLEETFDSYGKIIMPDDDVSRSLIETYQPKAEIVLHPIFLRWHRENFKQNVDIEFDEKIDLDDLPSNVVEIIQDEVNQSSDWWRRVGAVLFTKDGEVISSSHNQHMPSEHTPFIDGDMRMSAKRGDSIDINTAIHAEADLVARSAKEGTSTDGLEMLVSTFPCPSCAKSISRSGIGKVFYIEGYAVGDGLTILRNADIKIIKVEGFNNDVSSKIESRPYPEKSKKKS